MACLFSIIGCTSTKSGAGDTKSYSESYKSLLEKIPGNDSAYQANETKTYADKNDKLDQKSSALRTNAFAKTDGFSDTSRRRGLTNADSVSAELVSADKNDGFEQNSSALGNIAFTKANGISDTSRRQGLTNHATRIKSEFPTNTQDLVL